MPLAALLCAFLHRAEAQPPLQIGSKKFTESVILAEIVTQLLAHHGAPAAHRREIGGTEVLFLALARGDIDAYPEYTGTLRQQILREERPADDEAVRALLRTRGLGMSPPLGFNNTYALGMPEGVAERRGIRRISDLRLHPDLRLGFNEEFLARGDGWPGLRQRYGLSQTSVRGLDHDLSYRAMARGELDLTDLYATDAEIKHHRLRVLEDDMGYFPRYEAVLLYREDTGGRAAALGRALGQLAGRISEEQMRGMNARAQISHEPEGRVAAEFLSRSFHIKASAPEEPGLLSRLLQRTREHLLLVSLSLGLAVLAGLPLGILAFYLPRAGQVILGGVGVLQTLPSLALLVFLIPLLGIGAVPAMVALFLYSLLPIVRNTHAGLSDIPPPLRESAEALGLPAWARLRLIELPLSTRAILSGIKTACVINIGTATIGAIIGAGGYGQPILTGIRLNDTALLLEGAIPAALLAIFSQIGFDLVEHGLLPKGLKEAEVGRSRGRRAP